MTARKKSIPTPELQKCCFSKHFLKSGRQVLVEREGKGNRIRRVGSEGKSAPPADAHTSGDVPSSPQPTLPGLCTPRKVQRVIQWDNDYYGHWKYMG